MERSPPVTTSRRRIVSTNALFSLATPNVSCIASAIEFACVILPIPRDTSTVLPAKNTASIFASRSPGNALVSVTTGPPQYVPSFLCIRYCTERKLSENFKASPTTAASIIHPSAPGPPSAIAEATPTILPVPISAASSVISDANGETPASVFSPLYLASRPNAVRSAKNNRRMGSARSWMVRKMPVPSSRKRSGGPQAAAFTAFRNALIFSSVAISIPPCTKFQRKAVPVPPLLNGFLSMHRNVFSALYAAPHKKRTRQQPYDPSGSFDLHLILLYSASARFSGFLLF